MAKNNSDKKKKSNTKTGDSSNIETEEKKHLKILQKALLTK